ncbi:MAG: hypothetical protein AAF602_23195, partial [Myxococcota bacterium]
MIAIEDDIIAAGAQIVWVLEKGISLEDGTAELCYSLLGNISNSRQGYCVGDDETQPVAGTFDDSPFSVNRGFDIIVDRRTMRIVWESSHGSTGGNDNPEASEVLAAVEEAVAAATAA